MKIYYYDDDTLEYIGTGIGTLDPVATQREGKPIFTIPAHATDQCPLENKDGYACCFVGNKWQYFEDHRGQVVYRKSDLQPVTISTVGPISSLYIKELPKRNNKYESWDGTQFVISDIEQFKNTVLNDINMAYQDKLNAYYKINKNYSMSPKWLQTYSNLYVYFKLDIADGNIDEEYNITVKNNKTGNLEVIPIKSSQDFDIYFKNLKNIYKKLTTEYQKCVSDIQNCNDSEQIINYVQKYSPEIIKIKES